jgi:hypothetical protein
VSRVDDPAPDFTSMLKAAVDDAVAPDWPAQQAIAEVQPVISATPKVAHVIPGGLDGIGPAAEPAAQPMHPPRTRPLVPASRSVEVEVAPMPAPSAIVPAPIVPAVVDVEVEAEAAIDDDPTHAALLALGMPATALAVPAREDEPAPVALVRMLERLPAPPPMPRSQGAIVAVVGERDRGLEVAERLGLDTSEIVVASRRRGADVRSVDDAEERRRAWRRRRRATVVVVDTSFGISGDRWAAEMLGAFEPVVAIGHVEASRKPEDVRAWAEGLGGLDALALEGLGETTTPAAVLSVGVPVALLDGDTATPARWAAILTDRMAALAA